MPTYQFECKHCGKKFHLIESISDHDQHKERCPSCESKDLKNIISAVSVQTSKKS